MVLHLEFVNDLLQIVVLIIDFRLNLILTLHITR
jgi:hypothetical protein